MINFLRRNKYRFIGLFALIIILVLTKIVVDIYMFQPPVKNLLANKGTIYGRIIDKNTKNPVVGAKISLDWKTPYYRPPRSPFDEDRENRQSLYTATSDNNGNYHFIFDIPNKMRKQGQFIFCVFINRDDDSQLSCSNSVELDKRINSEGTEMIFRVDFNVKL